MPWPRFLDLDLRKPQRVHAAGRSHEVELLEAQHRWQPDGWSRTNATARTLAEALVKVRVDDQVAMLRLRPFEWPVTVGPLQLLVNTTWAWAHECDIHKLQYIQHDVRLEWLTAGEPWGPQDLTFPIRNYRWRANSYNNTWAALVPFNSLYYHRGEDYGAIPDELDVVAMSSGTVIQMPAKAELSNTVRVQDREGYLFSYAHMNMGSLNRSLGVQSAVTAGTVLGKTGATWQGTVCQHTDPHLHLDITDPAGQRVASFPIAAQAYFRSYPDAALPIAGGYAHALPGQRLTLDAGRSLARPGRRITAYQWRLHDGQMRNESRLEMVYDRCGHFSEELTVVCDDGSVARDFLQVRVYPELDSNAPADRPRLTTGWCYHHPVRGIRPGMPILFWNRLRRAGGVVQIDFGDASPPRPVTDQITHAYQHPGLYSVRLTAQGSCNEPITLAMPVHVEP